MTLNLPPDATPEEWESAVRKMWRLARTHDHSIPSHWLDSMRDRLLADLSKLDDLHNLLYTAQRTTGSAREHAINSARLCLSKLRATPLEAVTQRGVPDEREQFEAELRRQCFQAPSDSAKDLAWSMWQSRAILPAAPPAPVQQPARGVPDGWVLVPVEPTPEMIHGFWGDITHGGEEVAAAKAAYALMLAAAPPAPVQQGGAGWKCFHCGEAFTDKDAAAEHFGTSEFQNPACTIDIAEHRRMEALVKRYCEEDTDLHREIHRAQSDGQQKAIRAEEAGYARGLEDAKKHPEELGLTVAPPQAQPSNELGELIGCFDAAMVEGLSEALAETQDERLKDLVERRLMVGYWRAVATPPQAQPSAPECYHDETERLGAIWTRCTQCGKKWADDEAQPSAQERKPIRDAEIDHEAIKVQNFGHLGWEGFHAGVRFAEQVHGIGEVNKGAGS